MDAILGMCCHRVNTGQCDGAHKKKRPLAGPWSGGLAGGLRLRRQCTAQRLQGLVQ
jgi:hypothetical protein